MNKRQLLEELITQCDQDLSTVKDQKIKHKLEMVKSKSQWILAALGTTEEPAKEEPRHEDDDDFPEGAF